MTKLLSRVSTWAEEHMQPTGRDLLVFALGAFVEAFILGGATYRIERLGVGGGRECLIQINRLLLIRLAPPGTTACRSWAGAGFQGLGVSGRRPSASAGG